MGKGVPAAIGRAAALSLSLVLGCVAGAAALGGVTLETVSATDEVVIFEARFERPRVVQVDVAGRTYLETTLGGCDLIQRAGEPQLPVHYVELAVPPNAIATATLVEQEEEMLAVGRPLPAPELFARAGDGLGEPDRVDADYIEAPAVYEGLSRYPAPPVSAGAPERWRHLRVVQVAVHPVSYDPQGGRLLWHPRVRVQVRFVEPQGLPKTQGAQAPFLQEEPAWEPLFRQRLVNHERARGYKRTAASAGAPPALRRMQATEAAWEVQLAVDTTDVYAVTFEQLQAKGAAVHALPWDELRMEVRTFEESQVGGATQSVREVHPIGFLPEDDGDGVFEPGESLIFYGEDAWDCFDLAPQEKRYLRRNVYWLVASGGESTAMETLPGTLSQTGLTPIRDFVHTLHFERNLHYMPTLARDEGGEGPQAFRTDHYNVTHPLVGQGAGSKFQMVTVRMPKVDQMLELKVRLQGQYRLQASLEHIPRLWLSRSRTLNDTTWAFPGNPYHIPETDDSLIVLNQADLAAAAAGGAAFSTGANYVKIYLPTPTDDIDRVRGDGIGIDWIEATYRGLFWMQYDRLLAPVAARAGVQQLEVERITGTSTAPAPMVALDISDPRRPRVFALDASLFTPSGTNRWDLRLQVDFGAEPSDRTFLFLERDAVVPLPAAQVKLRPAASLPPYAGEDYIAIYPRRFGAALEPLLAQRESQGHRVYRAPIEDVYAEYSGGRPHVYAVKYLVREMWRDGVQPPPDWLLLVGDASVDLSGSSLSLPTRQSDSTYVPVMTVPGHFPAAEGYQIVSSDHWFVDNLLGGWHEPMSYNEDMFVGRVPVDTPSELAVFVEKVVAYEQQEPAASWRHRVLMHSDDGFSTRGDTGNYYNADRSVFEDITGRAAAFIGAGSGCQYWVVDSLYHSAMMDSVLALGRCVPDELDPTRCKRDGQGQVVLRTETINIAPNQTFGEMQVNAELRRLLDRGVLIWAFQGHSNRGLLTHENVLRYNSLAQEVDELANFDRLFIHMGFGCHLAEYADVEEGWSLAREAMVEEMLRCCPGERKGAVAAFASSDYEWIGHRMEEHVFQVMYQNLPKDDEGRSRWRPGELFALAKTYLTARDPQRLTYTYLGDPALRIGVEPPQMSLSVDGVPWLASELVSASEDDSVTLVVEVCDESHVTVPRVWDYVLGAHQEVPESLLVVSPVAGDDRRLSIEYTTELQRRPYTIIFTTRDAEGTERTRTLQVPFALALYEEPAGGDPIPIANQALLSAQSRLRVTLRTGVHLTEGDLSLRLDGQPLALASASSETEEGGVVNWTLRFDPPAEAPVALVPLEVVVRQRDGQDLALVTYEVQFGDLPLELRHAEWIPSPFADRTTLVYELTSDAGRARLRLYTASGRRIVERHDLRATRGVHGYAWDGRDDDGDPVANGLYFYEVKAWDAGGREVGSVLEKVVRVR